MDTYFLLFGWSKFNQIKANWYVKNLEFLWVLDVAIIFIWSKPIAHPWVIRNFGNSISITSTQYFFSNLGKHNYSLISANCSYELNVVSMYICETFHFSFSVLILGTYYHLPNKRACPFIYFLFKKNQLCPLILGLSGIKPSKKCTLPVY